MKYVNDSPKQFANCVAKPIWLCGKPHVILFASVEIKAGTELRYDYGGLQMPWRQVFIYLFIYFYLFEFSTSTMRK